MIKKVSILFLIIGFSAISGIAQTSSQATMRVSVRVVSGISIDFKQSQQVLSSSEGSDLGELHLKGVEGKHLLVDISPDIKVVKEDEGVTYLKVTTKLIHAGNDRTIKLWGSSNSRVPTSTYEGSLTATIHYL